MSLLVELLILLFKLVNDCMTLNFISYLLLFWKFGFYQLSHPILTKFILWKNLLDLSRLLIVLYEMVTVKLQAMRTIY